MADTTTETTMEMMTDKAKSRARAKKALRIILNVLVYLFFALCMVALIISVTAKKDSDGTVNLFGAQMRIVMSPSMEKCDQTDVSGYKIKDIPVKSMVFIKTVPDNAEEAERWYADLKVGDVLTFKYVYTRQEVITHRIVEITPKETGGYIIKLEGDNKNSDSNTLTQEIDTSNADSPNYVIGKVTGVSRFLGLLITAVKSPVGIVCIIIIPCAIIVILEVIRIVEVMKGDKKKKERAEQAKKDEELEALKQRLAELEQSKSENAGDFENSEETDVEDKDETSNETAVDTIEPTETSAIDNMAETEASEDSAESAENDNEDSVLSTDESEAES